MGAAAGAMLASPLTQTTEGCTVSNDHGPALSEETPEERKHRLNACAAFGAFSAWLEARPKLPAPDRTIAHVMLQPTDLEDEQSIARYVLLLADEVGAEAYENDDVLQLDVDVTSVPQDGAVITYRVSMFKVKAAARRYVAGTGAAR